MPALFVFLIKVNIALILFCAGYYLVLRHLTFYTLNRVYLVTAILFSTLYTRIDLSGFFERHEAIVQPIRVVAINWQTPVETFTKPMNSWYWVEFIFWAGVGLLAGRFMVQLFSLYRLHKQSQLVKLNKYTVRTIKGDVNPFSFWRSIYINPAIHEHNALESILEHEQIHVNEWHTLDIILGELATIFYWFNPGIWLMKKAIRENIEFITDREILQKGADTKAYQYTLLQVNFGGNPNAIVNHFNISTIKKRIIMMNTKKSSKINLTRYAVLLPALVLLLLVFTVSKAELGAKISKGSNSMYKSIKAAVISTADAIKPSSAEVNQPDGAKMLTTTRRTIAMLSAISPAFKSQDTIKIRNGNVLITPKTNPDSIVYIIDGKVVKNFQASNINPNDIANINITKAESGALHGASIVMINTKGAAVNMRPGVKIVSGTSTGVGTSSAGVIQLNNKVKGHLSNVVITTTNDSARTVYVTGKHGTGRLRSDSVGYAYYTSPVVTTYTIGTRNGASDSAITVTGYSSAMKDFKNAIAVKGNPRAMTAKSNSVHIDHITDKLIILNGEKATEKELKKVPASDIETISVLGGDTAKAAYGDEGAKGVVVITTKKGKK